MSGQPDVAVREGDVPPTSINPAQPEVVARGRMRPSPQELWRISIFLVNAENYPNGEGSRCEYWLFPPELRVETRD